MDSLQGDFVIGLLAGIWVALMAILREIGKIRLSVQSSLGDPSDKE